MIMRYTAVSFHHLPKNSILLVFIKFLILKILKIQLNNREISSMLKFTVSNETGTMPDLDLTKEEPYLTPKDLYG